jgi:hypothetical protein
MHQMNQQEFDRAAYCLAKDFLLHSGKERGVTPELIEKYLHLSTPRPDTLPGVYERILESGQNAERKAKVIGGAIGGVHKLKPVLCGFDPAQVIRKYPTEREVFENVVTHLKPRDINRSSKGMWPQYCRTILSAAKFLSQFASSDDFYEWVGTFDGLDDRARPALPMLLAQEIDGFGFALACDFVKELGYENFSKPDAHIKDIFWALGLSPWGTNDYEVFKAVARVAQYAGVTPYNVDKLFWLIGSGYFYGNPEIGINGRIGRRKKQFIETAQTTLEQVDHLK